MENKERFSALYFRDFRLLWISQIISFTGTWMHSTAQGWLVYSLTKSPFYLGLVSAASSLPVMLFTLFGGVAADRFKKRNLLLITQAASVVPPLVVGVLTSMGVVTVWQVIVFAALLGVVNAFDVPARQSFLVEIVERGNLLNAIALNSAAFNGARIMGPIVAGLTIAYIGLPACFYINSLSFLAVVSALAMMSVRGEVRAFGGKSILKEFLEGMNFIKGQPDVLRMLLLLVVFSLFGIPFITLLPVFADEILHVGVKGLGFLAGSAGLGAFSAAIYLAFKKEVYEKKRHMTASTLLFPSALFLFSLSKHYYLSMICLVFAGWAVVNYIALANTSIQLRTPDGIRGRVMSVYTLVFLGMAPLGNTIMGTVADNIGTATAVTFASALCLAASVLFRATLR